MPSAHSLNGLMKWLTKEPWRAAFEELLERHITSVLDEYDIQNFDELGGLIDVHWAMTLWGCAFEDFLTKEVKDAGNIVDDYLKRRGWKESAANKLYMAGLKNSVMSLYEISDIEPGRSFLARDLIRGGAAVRVSERSATKMLKPWDRVALRIVDVRGTKVIGGGLLPFERESSEVLVAMFGDDANEKPTDIMTIIDRLGIDQDDPEIAHLFGAPSNKTELLRSLAPVFSLYFLDDLIERIVAPIVPEMLNSDGEELEFMRLVYPLGSGATEAQVRAVLNQAPNLEAASQTFWNWIEPRRINKKKRKTDASLGVEFVTTTENDSIVLGTIELKSNRLELCVNSEGRAERGREELEPLLDDLVKAPLVEHQTLGQALREHGEHDPVPAALDLPRDERCRIVHEAMDNHYRAQMDEPIPALGNISPRKAIQSKKGRDEVVAWLKLLENRAATHDSDDPMASYDATWIWEELGVLDLRK
jgi:hypothetical protein